MAKFTIVLCVLMSAYGAQAGLMSIGIDVMESNIIAIMEQLSTYQTNLESAAGMSVQELINEIATISNEREQQLSELMSASSGSSACSTYMTQLRQARNTTVNNMVTNAQSIIDNAKSQTVIAIGIGEVLLEAAKSAETESIECISNIFTMIPCFQKVRAGVSANIISKMPEFTVMAIEMMTNQATMMANMATLQINAISDFKTMADDLYKVSQECVANSVNTV